MEIGFGVPRSLRFVRKGRVLVSHHGGDAHPHKV
jgi:hypothetical protein